MCSWPRRAGTRCWHPRDQRRHRRDRAEVREVRVDRPDRGASVQLDAQDHRRRGRHRCTTAGLPTCAPETAQGIFVNFGNVLDTMRRKLPFGVAQVGKAFRNEITRRATSTSPDAGVRADGDRVLRDALPARTRRRTRPGSTRGRSGTWISACGETTCASANRTRPSSPTTPSGASISSTASRWGGASSRGSRTAPTSISKAHSRSPENPGRRRRELRYFDQEKKQHIVPYVIEPSAGADRATLAFLCDAYDESLVKEPPVEETTKLRELVHSFAKSVDKRDPKQMEPAVKERLMAAADKIAAGLPGSLPELVALSDDADANRIEVWKKVARRGRAARRGSHAHGPAPAPAPGAHHGGRLPAQEERAAPGRDGPVHQGQSPESRGPARRL